MKKEALLILAFGGPEKEEEVRPFVERVVQGRAIPQARIEEVIAQYREAGKKSPFKELTFKQARALEESLKSKGHALPCYVGMLHSSPFLSETIQKMARNGVTKAFALIMSVFQSEVSWEKYQKKVQEILKEEKIAMEVTYLPPFYHHPLFVRAVTKKVREALVKGAEKEQEHTALLFSAHSIPCAMAERSPYAKQFRWLSFAVGSSLPCKVWLCAYQSRSGAPSEAWLEPDISQALQELKEKGIKKVVVAPVGFLSDHMEVLFDLDIKARKAAEALGISFVRAETVQDDPDFVAALTDLVEKAMSP